MSVVKKKRDSRKGQGVVEFALVSLLFFSMFLFTLNGILAFTVHQYISYAAFMTARALQSSSETYDGPGGQLDAARATINSYVNMQFTGKELARVTDVYIPESPPPYGYDVASREFKVRVVFEVPLIQFPIGGMSDQFGWVELEAVSYLGREPTVSECRAWFGEFWDYYEDQSPGSGGGGMPWGDRGMADNNC